LQSKVAHVEQALATKSVDYDVLSGQVRISQWWYLCFILL